MRSAPRWRAGAWICASRWRTAAASASSPPRARRRASSCATAPSTCWRMRSSGSGRRSGSFWKGDETGERLQRIYGTAFATPEELDAYLARLEEARARDHRRIGQELDLFSFSPLAPASPFMHPKGAVIYNGLTEYTREV